MTKTGGGTRNKGKNQDLVWHLFGGINKKHPEREGEKKKENVYLFCLVYKNFFFFFFPPPPPPPPLLQRFKLILASGVLFKGGVSYSEAAGDT